MLSMDKRRGGLTKSKRMLVQRIKVKGIRINNLYSSQSSASSKLDPIHNAYGGRNGTLQVELNKATKSIYKIRHAEKVKKSFKIDFSEGIGSPAEAALTFRRLKEKYKALNN